MDILLFGVTGKVGFEIWDKLTFGGTSTVGISSPTREDIDLAETGQLYHFIKGAKPNIVINATAKNGMEACDSDRFGAFQINCMAPTAMAAACKELGALFIHMSTDYVFTGCEYGLDETLKPNPCGAYGWSKLKGEEVVATCGGNYFIFRLSSIYGRQFSGPIDAVRQAKEGKGTPDNPIMVLHQFCAPTSARLIADAIIHVITNTTPQEWKEKTGIYHLASSTGVWKKELSLFALNHFLGDQGWVVQEGRLAVPRPIHTRLKVTKFEATFGYKLPTWKADLEATAHLLPKA